MQKPTSLSLLFADPAFEPMECPGESPAPGNKRKYENRDSDSSKSPQESKRPNDLDLAQQARISDNRTGTNQKPSKDAQSRIDGTSESDVSPDHKSTDTHGSELNKPPSIFYSDSYNSTKLDPKRPFNGDNPNNKTSPPGVENLTIAPKNFAIKNSIVNGCVTKKLSLKSDSPRFSLDDSADDIFSKDVSHRLSSKSEPVTAETCSLTTEEGRRKCLASDQQRWDAYQSAMSKFGCEAKIDDTSPNSSQSNRTPKGPTKRKISDYFPKATPSPR